MPIRIEEIGTESGGIRREVVYIPSQNIGMDNPQRLVGEVETEVIDTINNRLPFEEILEIIRKGEHVITEALPIGFPPGCRVNLSAAQAKIKAYEEMYGRYKILKDYNAAINLKTIGSA